MQENITKELIIFSILASSFKVAKAPRETSRQREGGRAGQGVTLTAATEPRARAGLLLMNNIAAKASASTAAAATALATQAEQEDNLRVGAGCLGLHGMELNENGLGGVHHRG